MSAKFTHKERRRLLIIGGTIFLLLSIWLIFSPVGIIKLYKIKSNLSAVRSRNQDLGERNQALQEEIDKLQDDPQYLEEIARKEFGLLKKNELIFKFKMKKRHR